VPITKSARIEIRPNGILGDKHVEIISGDPRDPPLRDGEQVLVVDDRASVDRLIGEVSKITKSLSAVAENMRAATEGDADKPLGRILDNIDRITTDLAELSSEKKDEIGEIIDNVHNVTSTIDDLINDESEDGFKAAWHDALHSLKRIEKTLKNVEEITDKVNRGEGTIGRLVNDESTVEELNTAISGINNLLDASNKLQTSIDFHSEAMVTTGGSKSILALQIQPGLDRYYELGVVSDNKGFTDHQVITTTVNGGSDTVTTQNTRYADKLKFNAMFAKNFYDFTLRGGVIESSGGFGADYYLMKRSLRLSLEVFDFSNFHVRSYARYSVFKGIYLTAGGDDIASKSSGSAFVGGGLFVTNDDLKLLLSRLPF
jgi:phospholipid/cholesterol/gamma-HCH transport system substrate-binding protein